LPVYAYDQSPCIYKDIACVGGTISCEYGATRPALIQLGIFLRITQYVAVGIVAFLCEDHNTAINVSIDLRCITSMKDETIRICDGVAVDGAVVVQVIIVNELALIVQQLVVIQFSPVNQGGVICEYAIIVHVAADVQSAVVVQRIVVGQCSVLEQFPI